MPEAKGTVLYVGGFELPDKNAAAHRVVSNAKILRELGFKVVFCGVDRGIAAPADSAEDVFGFESFPIPYPQSTKQWIKQLLTVECYSRLIEGIADLRLVICYNLHVAPLAGLIRLCRKRGIKLVADCTEWYENKLSLNPVKLIKCIDTALCMRAFQKKCDGMIAISSYLADYYKKSVKNMIVVPPLVDLSDEKYCFDGEKPESTVKTLVYSGSPSASKEDLGELVASLNSITDCDYRLKIVGITQSEFEKMYGIHPNEKIEFTGRVSHKEALNAVRCGDYAVIIRPKTRVTTAGFPTKFAEAISVGTAVIANSTSDLAQYLGNGKNGYLINSDSLDVSLRKILLSESVPPVESDTFDYKNYTAQFNVFLNDTFNS